MPADLTAIRALLASVQGFTPGPWVASVFGSVRPAGVSDDNEREHVCGYVPPVSRPLIAAAPTLHAHLTEAADEVGRLRDTVAWLTYQRDKLLRWGDVDPAELDELTRDALGIADGEVSDVC